MRSARWSDSDRISFLLGATSNWWQFQKSRAEGFSVARVNTRTRWFVIGGKVPGFILLRLLRATRT